MKGVLAFFWKDLKEFFNSKESVFWVFIFPLIFGVLFASVFGGTTTPENIPVGYVPEAGNSTMSQYFIEGMENVSIQNHKIFDIHKYLNESDGINAIKNGKIKALIIFDRNFTENISYGEMRIKVVFDKRDLQDYQIVSGSVLSYISSFEDRVRDARINITVEYAEEYGNLTISADELKNYLHSMSYPIQTQLVYYEGDSNSTSIESRIRIWYATAAIGITIVFSGMIGAASSISAEIERGTARRLCTTRTRPIEMLAGTLLYLLCVQLISAFLVVLSFMVVFREWIPISPEILGMIIVAALSTMAIGLLISSFTKTQRAASAATNAIAWPISFITGIFFPSFMLPEWMRVIGDYFPASALLRGVRKMIVYNQGIGSYITTIISAIVVTFILLILGSLAFSWRIRRV